MTDNTQGNGNVMSEARLAMHGRILRCPMGTNPQDCPLYKIRLLPIEERIAWLAEKTDEEVEALFQYHIKCLDKKTGSGPVE